MLVRVHVIPNSKAPFVARVDEVTLEVRVDERAEGWAANKRLLEILSEHYGVPRSKIAIVRGTKSRDKVLAVDTGRAGSHRK